MGKKSKYASIRSLRELQNASQGLSEQIRSRGKGVDADWRHVRSFYTPATLVNHFMDKATPAVNVAGFVVDLYDRIKENIALRRSQRHACATASDTATCPSDDAGDAPAPDATLQPEN